MNTKQTKAASAAQAGQTKDTAAFLKENWSRYIAPLTIVLKLLFRFICAIFRFSFQMFRRILILSQHIKLFGDK